MADYGVKDSEKFKIMTRVYSDIYVDPDTFAEKIGVGRSTVYNWLQKEFASFNAKSKVKVHNAFQLWDKVWSEYFRTEEEFEEALRQYKNSEEELPDSVCEKNITIGLKNVEPKDKHMRAKELTISDIDRLLEDRSEPYSASFMFEIAKRLRSEKRISDALGVLEWIDEQESSFKYLNENQLKHFKAVLLSHEHIQDYDGAIHLLRSLYFSAKYHKEEPEILTLLASNYKRKALAGDPVNMELVTSALCLYEDAYNHPCNKQRYYDAVNLAYLYNIVDAIEVEYADKVEIERLYRELLKEWTPAESDWWQVISDAEIVMLLGRVELAISKLNYFLENHRDQVDAFKIDTTLRQLNLYIDITNDNHAKQFANYLEESWENLR